VGLVNCVFLLVLRRPGVRPLALASWCFDRAVALRYPSYRWPSSISWIVDRDTFVPASGVSALRTH
jgi:hypothetical protein